MDVLLISILSLGAGAMLGRWGLQSRHAVAASRVDALQNQLDEHLAQRELYEIELRELRSSAIALETTLEHERAAAAERLGDEQRLVSEFERLSNLTLRQTRAELERSADASLKLANERAKNELAQQKMGIEHLVKPVQENLLKLEQHIAQSEHARKEEYGGLFQQMQQVAATNGRIQKETADLKSVLRSSSATRGRWGEVQLRRVVELAGMSEHCDFSEQEHVASEDGNARADLIAYLPGNMKIAVDAKVPYDAYERAQNEEDLTAQSLLLAEHSKRFRAHVDALVKREYWNKYAPSCGFAVLFVPGEALLDAACTQDPQLWEHAASRNILLATPSTLIALLRMAALGWRQQAQAENAIEITKVGRELHKRLAKAGTHIVKMGRGLGQAIGSYNEFVGSMESRVMPSARKLGELGAGDGELFELTELTDTTRPLRPDVFLVDRDADLAAIESKRNVG